MRDAHVGDRGYGKAKAVLQIPDWRSKLRHYKEKENFLHVVFVEAVDEVGARTNCDGHHAKRGILARRRDEARAVHDEEIFYVMCLVEWGEDRFFGVSAHARRAQFVDGHARFFDARLHADVFGASRFQHFCSHCASVVHERRFVVAVRHGDAQRRDAPRVF